MLGARFTVVVVLAACGGAHETVIPPRPSAIPDAGLSHLLDDPDLNHAQPKKLLAIDWDAVTLATDADALALWAKIAPTGDDWQAKLDEVPDGPIASALARALVHEGNFACAAPPPDICAKVAADLPDPAETATLTDPCLRRVLALWSLDQLAGADRAELAKLHDALRAIAALPAPESQLIANAIHLAEADPDLQLELVATAWQTGQHALINGLMGALDEPHLIEAATKLHIDGAYDGLTAKTQRALFLKAISDEQLQAPTRAQAMVELAGDDDKLPPELITALAAVTKSPNCEAAADAARLLERYGNATFVPKRPKSTKPEAVLRGLCVLASYEGLLHNDEVSPLVSYLPPKGLEVVRVTYDPDSVVDADGDGDPHTVHTNELLERATASLPELSDFVLALKHCVKTTCSSDERDFKLTIRDGLFVRMEIIDKPPCQKP